jgi:Nuclease subunit of the excinuclease complex
LLPRRSEALFLLQRVRNEAHRFAVTFHRKRRAKRSVASQLDSLKGVGPSRRKLLLDHFGSFDKIKAASLDELQLVPSLPYSLARKIYEQLNTPEIAQAPPDTVEAGHLSESDATSCNVDPNESG